MDLVIGLSILSFIVLITGWLWLRASRRSSVLARLAEDDEPSDVQAGVVSPSEKPLSGIQGWLFRAGLRKSYAQPVFWVTTVLCFLVSVSIWYVLERTATIAIAVDALRSIPGGVGNVMVPFALSVPWFFVAVLTLTPTLVVRSIRRRRVIEIEQDIPLVLDLLSTLAQAGFGFDAALDRILEASGERRPLVMEFRGYQADQLAGRSRVNSLLRLMGRIDIQAFSTFISALVQSEQVGASMSTTLKAQAAEFRARRREKASSAAMSVPTLLVFPMVIGFLPGIFVIFLGPMIYEASGAMGQTLRGVTGL